MSSTLLFFDSNDANRNFDTNSINDYKNAFANAADESNDYHSFNISYNLKNKLSNVKRILLKSVEMPLILNNIRNSNKSNILSFTFKTAARPVFTPFSIPVIDQKPYTNILNLLSDVNQTELYINDYEMITGNVLFQQVQNFYGRYICKLITSCTYLKLDNTVLNNEILGFAKDATTTTGELFGIKPITLFPETFFYMHITNITCTNSTGNATFKIPFNTTYSDFTGIIIYNDIANLQSVTLQNNNNILDKLNIVIYDRWGFPVIGLAEWTMTLIIEFYD